MFANRLTGKSGQIARSVAACLLFIGFILLSLSASDAANRHKSLRSKTASAQSPTQSIVPSAATQTSSTSPQCSLPGVQVLNDPAGDQTGTPNANQQLDLTAAYVAEPFVSNTDHSITFTIKVSTLSPTLPPNATWQLNMVTTDTNGTSRTIFFDMNTASTGATASFDYGYHDPSQNIDLSQCGIPVPLISSCPVTGSSTADGTITITVNTSQPLQFFDATGTHAFDVNLLAAGKSLTNMNAVTTLLVGAGGSGIVTTIDQMTTGTGSYLTVGNGACSGSGTPTPTPSTTPTPTPTPTATPTAPPVAGANIPRYQIYMSPQGVADSAGEPSIGSNWTNEAINHNHKVDGSINNIPNGGTSLYFGGFLPSMLKVTWDDCSSPAGILWEAKPLLSASTPRAAGDPILFTDHETGRTFCGQLEGLTPAGCTIDITDNDGDTFLPSDGVIPSDVDHETIGGGHYHTPLPQPGPIYPNAIYYASQSIAEARAFRSDNGGFAFSEAAAPMYTDAQCAGLHGHIKVAPDGTVYVPNVGCGGALPFHDTGAQQAVVVSEDNGITWNVRPIPDSTTNGESDLNGTIPQTRDPSVALATDGTVYFAYQAANGHAMIAVSHDKGVTWSSSVDVGAAVINGGPVLNSAFPVVVAGDPNRATFTFFGTETGGSNWDCGAGTACGHGADFTGVWYLYVATTYDGGATWVTQNITPGDPIQRGGICEGGTCRNLLDFYDATIDKEGRVVIGYDDGCITAACINGGPNDFASKAAIARQSGGKRMFAAFDPAEPVVPGAPLVTGSLNGAGTSATLTWPTPDNGGAPITSYNVYRKVGSGAFTLLASVNIPAFTDPNFTAGDAYHVTAVNSKGEGSYCADVTPTVVVAPDPCVLPGVLALIDNDGDPAPNLPPDPRVDIQQLFVAEPLFNPAADKLVFTLQVGASTTGSPPASSQWYIIWNRQGTDPSDSSDASYDRMYVAMKTDATGAVSFDYGKFGIPLNEVPPPPPDPNANTPKSYGAPDGGSYDPATGIIRITISNDKFRVIDGGANSYVAGTNLNALNVRTYLARPDAGQKSQNNANDITPNGGYTLAGNASCVKEVPLLGAVSRKTHGSAGTFDIGLPLTGNPGIECRSGGTNGDHTIVFVFANPITGVTGASTSAGSVSSRSTGSDPHEYVVNLTGVPNGHVTTVTLTGVTDTAGNSSSSIAVPVGILLGDTNADTAVNSGDISQTKSQSGQTITIDNFREDLNVDGAINSADISLVKSKSGTALQ